MIRAQFTPAGDSPFKPSEMIRVLIADDQRMFRTAISRSLADVTGIEVIGEAGDGEEAVRMAIAPTWC